MIKKCYYVENNPHAVVMVSALSALIPCFIDAKTVDSGLEVELTFRAEDAAFVERCFAPYV